MYTAKLTRPIVLILMLLAVGSVLLVACARPGTVSSEGPETAQTNAENGPTVHMSDFLFVQESITISKGSSLTLVADTGTPHIIQNGTWEGGAAKVAVEEGAPKVDQTWSGNDSRQIGPFTTAGTFKLYCTIHPGMNLTVIVE